MVTLAEAHKRQTEWQAQGRRLLERYDIKALLAELGEFEFQGSFLYGLMVKPDIDGRIYVDEPQVEAVARVAAKLMILPGAVRTMVNNFTQYPPHPGMPQGIYLGWHVDFERQLWNFDIWILNPRDELGDEFLALVDEVPVEQKDIMLLLKYQLKERGLYPGNKKIKGSFSSADVYRSVMRGGVKTLHEALIWRQQHKSELD